MARLSGSTSRPRASGGVGCKALMAVFTRADAAGRADCRIGALVVMPSAQITRPAWVSLIQDRSRSRASGRQTAPAVRRLGQLAQEPRRRLKDLMHIPPRAGPTETRALQPRGGRVSGDGVCLIDPNEKEWNSSGTVEFEYGQPTGDLLVRGPERFGHVLHIMVFAPRRGIGGNLPRWRARQVHGSHRKSEYGDRCRGPAPCAVARSAASM